MGGTSVSPPPRAPVRRPRVPRRAPGGGRRTVDRRAPVGQWWPWALAVAAAAALLGLLASWLTSDLGSGPTVIPSTSYEEKALGSASHFLDTYMDADGRVVRRDQGDSTVSEGQAYAMLLAAAIGDRDAFDRAWSWTRENLQRSDGLLSSLWESGRVVDASPAADADLDAAHALLIAAQRFGDDSYRADGLRMAGAILNSETVQVNGKLVLVAGTWARGAPPTIDPSYFDPRAYALLGGISGDPRWDQLETSSRELLDRLAEASPLPPDWARVEPAGPVAIPSPNDPPAGIRSGFDAVRVPVRWAAACAPENRAIAARDWSFLGPEEAGGRLAGEYSPDGRPLSPATPASLVGAAGAARAAGRTSTSDGLLDRAASADAANPTYYGAAWVALGRVMLTTDWLGPC
jgi:hypothetical protein